MFKYQVNVEIRFNDIDSFEHVNNAIYLSYFEQARLGYLRDVFKDSLNWTTEGFIIAKAIVDYKFPVFLKDKIAVKIRCSRIGNSSFDFAYEVVKYKGDAEIICATGTTVMVAFNYAENKVIPIPEKWKTIFNEFDTI